MISGTQHTPRSAATLSTANGTGADPQAGLDAGRVPERQDAGRAPHPGAAELLRAARHRRWGSRLPLTVLPPTHLPATRVGAADDTTVLAQMRRRPLGEHHLLTRHACAQDGSARLAATATSGRPSPQPLVTPTQSLQV